MVTEWIITLPPEERERTAFHESGVRDTAPSGSPRRDRRSTAETRSGGVRRLTRLWAEIGAAATTAASASRRPRRPPIPGDVGRVMHAVDDPGHTHGCRMRPGRRRQSGHFLPDAGGERRRGGGVPGRKQGGDRRPARAAIRRYLAGRARPYQAADAAGVPTGRARIWLSAGAEVPLRV